MNVKLVNKSNNESPFYSTPGSAGMDLKAFEKYPVTIEPMERVMVHTGIYIQLPEGHEAQIRPRSGMAIKNGITVINTPGTVDEDYINEVCVLLINLSDESYTIKNGDRIAQMVINKYEKCQWEIVDELTPTERVGGFGSTGV